MRLSRWLAHHFFLSLLVSCSSAGMNGVVNEITYVKRNSQNSNDRFGLTKNCGSFSSEAIGSGGECQCKWDINTFLYFKGYCVNNSVVHHLLNKDTECNGKKLLYLKEYGENPFNILTLTTKNGVSLNVMHQIDPNVRVAINEITNSSINGSGCGVSKIQYINDFNGNLMNTSRTYSDKFTIDKDKKKLTWDGLQSNNLTGRVLCLKTDNCIFKYGKSSKISNPCIVFKAQGRVSFTVTTSSTISSRQTDSTIGTTSLIQTAISSESSSPAGLSTTQSLQPTSTQLKMSTHSYKSMTTPVTIAPIKPSPTTVSPKGKSKASQKSVPVGAIVGTVMALLAVAIIIVLIFLWRRRRQTLRKNSKAKNGPNNPDNPVYGKSETIDLSHSKATKNTDNDLVYDYAAVDGDPRMSNGTQPGIYQSLVKDPNRESVYTPLDRGQGNGTDPPNEYNKLERPLFKPAHQGPTEPTYNALEGPNSNTPIQAPQNNEPVYNVLEDPNPEGVDEPEYNVLEGPNEPDEPDYNVLEDPDDNYDNAPVEESNGRHSSSHDNIGYESSLNMKPKLKPKPGAKNEPVYAAPDGSSSDQTYQPLQINGPSDNVYQPLDNASRVAPNDEPMYHVLESNT